MPFGNIYKGKKVVVTGHTGFKGAWLCEWLLNLGAEVVGLSLPTPPNEPAIYQCLRLEDRVESHNVDLRNLGGLSRAIENAQPDFLFHLAAQALVRHSYEQPIETFAVNTLGTAHVLESMRLLKKRCAVVVVTTDKCYENHEWLHSYREEDPLGGYDPYSASKGAAELVVASYRRSFFSHDRSVVVVASARAGNVIGGGDWALDRILPDCIQALACGKPVPVRNRQAIRPWQHVLEPLSGYLWLGAALAEAPNHPYFPYPQSTYTSAFNFGPEISANCSVEDLVKIVLQNWPGTWEDHSDPSAPHEAKRLNLSIDKAFHLLKWTPTWSLDEGVKEAVAWYKAYHKWPSFDPQLYCVQQIDAYVSRAREKKTAWALY